MKKEMVEEKIKVYSQDTIYKKGFLPIFKGMVENLLNGKELAWQLFKRDFKAKYRQSLLGWAWLFLMPFVTMGTFLLLNVSGVIRIGDIPVPYPIFGLLGISIWNIFSAGLTTLTASITAAGSLVSKINFPKEALIISSLGQIVVEFLIRLALVFLVYLTYGLLPSPLILLFPLFILPITFLTLGLGFLTSVLDIVVRDTSRFINLGMNFLLFLMPIMYTMPEKGLLARVNKYNPLFFLIKTPRDIIISGRIIHPEEFAFSTILSIVIFFGGWFIFYVSQPKLAERV